MWLMSRNRAKRLKQIDSGVNFILSEHDPKYFIELPTVIERA